MKRRPCTNDEYIPLKCELTLDWIGQAKDDIEVIVQGFIFFDAVSESSC